MGSLLDVERARHRWARAEELFLEGVGLITFAVGLGLILSGNSVPEFRLLLSGAGVALAVAGLLAFSRVREDLVSAIVAGVPTAWFGVILVVLPSVKSTQAAADDLGLPAAIAALAVLVRAFRGGFRAEQAARGWRERAQQ